MPIVPDTQPDELSALIALKVSPEEQKLIESAAVAAGITAPQWIRRAIAQALDLGTTEMRGVPVLNPGGTIPGQARRGQGCTRNAGQA